MTEELSKTEARQGDRRRTNFTALWVGVILAFVLMAGLWMYWS